MKDPYFPTEFQTSEFAAAWQLWTDYRKERKLSAYKTIGHKMQMTRLLRICGNPQRAIAAIEYSIAQNYQGIYEDSNTRRLASANPRTQGTLNAEPGRYATGPGVLGGKRPPVLKVLPDPGTDSRNVA